YYRGSYHRFLAKARPEHRIVTNQIGKNYFYRMSRLEKDVGGLIDNSHSSMAQTAFELITSVEHEIPPERIPQSFPVSPTVVESIGKTGSAGRTLFHCFTSTGRIDNPLFASSITLNQRRVRRS